MPTESGRKTARKRITIPGGGNVEISVPVITEISFIDPADRYQETRYSIDSSSGSTRLVHVDQIYQTDSNGNQDKSTSIDVERVDWWPTRDRVDRGQETRIKIDNITGAENAPPSFTTHLKTHLVKYHRPDQDSPWVESELIDQLKIRDTNGQEIIYTLKNTDEQASDSYADITDELLDPPYRLDPFQNIVNWFNSREFSFSIVAQAFFSAGWASLPLTEPSLEIGSWTGISGGEFFTITNANFGPSFRDINGRVCPFSPNSIGIGGQRIVTLTYVGPLEPVSLSFSIGGTPMPDGEPFFTDTSWSTAVLASGSGFSARRDAFGTWSTTSGTRGSGADFPGASITIGLTPNDGRDGWNASVSLTLNSP